MGKIYVISIGGSGSRVLRSLSMLLAGGMSVGDNTIVPVIIDTDTKNGNYLETKEILEQYNLIRNELFDDNPASTKNSRCQYFRAKIENIYPIVVDGQGLGTLEDVIDKKSMGDSLDSLRENVDLLFSDENMAMPLQYGFIGNPNVGTVVLNYLFENNSQFKNFVTSIASDDRVILISSIFGGTGAAGFPLLANKLKTARPGLTIGSITLIPYYSLSEDAENVDNIDNAKFKVSSNNFDSKMNAALSYYEKFVNDQMNVFYYAGDSVAKSTYPNCLGGRGQCNPAHIVELMAALSIIDFSAFQPVGAETVYKSTIFDQPATEVNLNTIDPVHTEMKQALIRLWMLYLYINQYVSIDLANRPVYIRKCAVGSAELDINVINTGTGNNLKEYLQRFKKWSTELSDSGHLYHARQFQFVQLNASPEPDKIHTCFLGINVQTKKNGEVKPTNFRNKMADASSNIKGATPLGKLIGCVSVASDAVMRESIIF